MANYVVYLSSTKLIYFYLVTYVIVILLEFITKAEPSHGDRGMQYRNSTKHLQTIFTGRCYDHCKDTKNDCPKDIDCTAVWDTFKQAFVMKNQSDISPESYKDFVQNAAITIPKNKALFWSRTKEDAFQFANVAGYVTLEKTLIGLLGDGLVWCGENDNSELAEECLDPFTNGTATGSFWNKMSETFARTASGEVQVLLNGSTGLAFNSSSTFGSVEVYSLDPNKVSTMNIWILYYFNGSDWVIKESCKGHSIEKLKDILTAKNITSSCTENNRKLIHIQCARFSNESIYELCLSGVSNIDMTFSTTTLLAIIIAIHKWFEELVLHS